MNKVDIFLQTQDDFTNVLVNSFRIEFIKANQEAYDKKMKLVKEAAKDKYIKANQEDFDKFLKLETEDADDEFFIENSKQFDDFVLSHYIKLENIIGSQIHLDKIASSPSIQSKNDPIDYKFTWVNPKNEHKF